VANRRFWDVRYIPNEDTGDLFAAADFLLMTYSAKFRSASGVMNAAVNARKPILGSSGSGPFKSAILDYELGIFVRPDDDATILAGAREVLNFGPALARWSDYEHDHSWQKNADGVIAALTADR
jgi:hypothetical protein